MGLEGEVDLALVGGAVGEVAVVVVGDEGLGVHGRDVDGAADRLEPEEVGAGDAGGGAELGDQGGAQVPEGAADDAAVVVDLAGEVLGPVPLVADRVELAQRGVGLVGEEAAGEAGVVGDGRAEVVGDALAERALELADAGDEALDVHGVAVLVIDDVGDAGGVLAALAREEEVDRVAVGEGVADVGDVDGDLQLLIEEAEGGVDRADARLDDAGVGVAAELGVDLLAGVGPDRDATWRKGQVGGGDGAGVVEDRHEVALDAGDDGGVGAVGEADLAGGVGGGADAVDEHAEARGGEVDAGALRAALGDAEGDGAGREVEQGIAGDGLAGGAVEEDGVAIERAGGVDGDAHDLAVARALTGDDDREDEGALDGAGGGARRGVLGEDPGAGAGAGEVVGEDGGGEGDADVGQGLGGDGDQAVALEAKAELAAEHRATGEVLGEADAADAAAEVVADLLEVLEAAAGGEQGEVLGEQLAGAALRPRGAVKAEASSPSSESPIARTARPHPVRRISKLT